MILDNTGWFSTLYIYKNHRHINNKRVLICKIIFTLYHVPKGAYGLIMKRYFMIDNLYCLSFNKESGWMYISESVLKNITNFIQKFKSNPKIPWETYFKL